MTKKVNLLFGIKPFTPYLDERMSKSAIELIIQNDIYARPPTT